MEFKMDLRVVSVFVAMLALVSVSMVYFATASDTKNMLTIRWEKPVTLPENSKLRITLYDAMLADTDSTYAKKTVPIDKLPFITPLPKPITTPQIVGPAVGVSITSQDGKLLYTNDVVHFIQQNKTTNVMLKRIQ